MEEIEVTEYNVEENAPYTLDKLFGVAVMGALIAMAGYYIYNSLTNDAKQTIKDTVVSAFRTAISGRQEESKV